MCKQKTTSSGACHPYNQLLIVISREGMLPSFDAPLWNYHSSKGVFFESLIALQAFNAVELFSTRADKLSLCCLCPLYPSQALLTLSASSLASVCGNIIDIKHSNSLFHIQKQHCLLKLINLCGLQMNSLRTDM